MLKSEVDVNTQIYFHFHIVKLAIKLDQLSAMSIYLILDLQIGFAFKSIVTILSERIAIKKIYALNKKAIAAKYF